jgi:hypothetical protein
MRASNWNFGNTPSSAAGSGDSTPTPTPTPAADVTGTPAPAVVTPAAPAKPATPAVAALSLSGLVAKTKLGVALLKGLKTTVKCSAACKFTAQLVLPAKVAKKLKLKTLIAKASGSRTKAGSTVVTLKFTTAAKKALKKLRSVKATLVLTSGKTVSKKAVTLKR